MIQGRAGGSSRQERYVTELAKVRNRFRVLTERTSEGFIVLNSEGQVLFANRSARSAFSIGNGGDERLPFDMKVGHIQFGHITKGVKTIAIKLICERVVWDGQSCRLIRFRATDANQQPEMTDKNTGGSGRIVARDFLDNFAENFDKDDRFEVVAVNIPAFHHLPAVVAEVEFEAMSQFVLERLNGLVHKGCAFQSLSDDCWVGVSRDLDGNEGFFTRRVHDILNVDLPNWISARKLLTYVGGAAGSPSSQPVSALWDQAESAMILARHQGCADPLLYDEEMRDWLNATETMVKSLRAAVAEERMHVHYQPIIDLETGEAIGAEALVRLPHESLGVLRASEFIPLATEMGLTPEIDRFVATKAAETIASIRRNFGKEFPIMVNVSADTLSQESYAEHLLNLVNEYKIQGLFGIELSEQISVGEIEETIGRLQELKREGIQFAFDDFAMNESSLVLFRLLTPDYVKVDQSFVQRCTSSDLDVALIRSIISLADQLEVTAVAEGISAPDQMQLLRELGCKGGQGELIAMPFSEEYLNEFIHKPFEPQFALTETP